MLLVGSVGALACPPPGRRGADTYREARMALSDRDLAAFRKLHDLLQSYEQPWRLVCFENSYRIELRSPHRGPDIEAEATSLHELVPALSRALTEYGQIGRA